MDWLAGPDSPAEVRQLPKEELAALASAIATELRKGTASPETDSMFRQLRRDEKIEGVGVTVIAGKRPTMIVSKADFVGKPNIDDPETERTTTKRVQTTLVSPVLMLGDRRWKFRSATGEFGAPIKDQGFLTDVLNGVVDIRLRAGLVLDVDLETTEHLEDGAWVIDSRSVTKIHSWRNAPEQQDLLSGAFDIEPDEQ
jgi:hypothetical protein